VAPLARSVRFPEISIAVFPLLADRVSRSTCSKGITRYLTAQTDNAMIIARRGIYA
jgi:hypothetical protein